MYQFKYIFTDHQPLIDLIGKDNIEKLKIQKSIGLKRCFSILMHSPQDKITSCMSHLIEIFKSSNYKKNIISNVFLTLNRDFPKDVGCLCVFFLHIIQLQPGQAIYLPAKEPHAYLNGDCIECMACSDNVIRAGLTPKFKDVDTLIEMLSYETETIENKIFKPINERQFTKIFVPSVKDFAVIQIQVPSTVRKYTLRGSLYGSIVIVINGEAETMPINNEIIQLKVGSIVFFPANNCQDIVLNIKCNNIKEDEFQAYQAMYNEFL